ncbi:hypothetical protein EON67_12080, partial [archaeon]
MCRWYYYSWEALVMMRKALIVAIAAMTKDPVYQIGSATVLLVISFGLQLHASPYALPLFNQLEALTLAALIATLAVSLLYLRAASINGGPLSSMISVTSADAKELALQNSPGMLGEGSTTALLLFINGFTVATLAVVFIRLKRQEWKSTSTLWELVGDFWSCYRRKKRQDFIITEVSDRLRQTAAARRRAKEVGQQGKESKEGAPKSDAPAAAAAASAPAADAKVDMPPAVIPGSVANPLAVNSSGGNSSKAGRRAAVPTRYGCAFCAQRVFVLPQLT